MDPAHVVRVLEPLVLDRRKQRLWDVIGARLASVSVIFDSPYDPHNGAAVLRSCEAFGVQNLHVIERRTTPFLAAVSVARGATNWVDIHTHGSVEAGLQAVQAQGLELVSAHPEGELLPEDLASLPRVGIVLGNERDGIQRELADACRRRVRVPMRGFVESLNVSVTLAILLHAATKGRQGDLSEEDRLRLYARGLYFSVVKADEILALNLPSEGTR
jgi:tRNA (guanosine-2'-O-)-methyltransferase